MFLQSPHEQCLFTVNLVLLCCVLTALAVCSEDYFSAVAKMGEQALQTFTSHSLGKKKFVPDILVKSSSNERSHTVTLRSNFRIYHFSA